MFSIKLQYVNSNNFATLPPRPLTYLEDTDSTICADTNPELFKNALQVYVITQQMQ